jgi:hypothetical protein
MSHLEKLTEDRLNTPLLFWKTPAMAAAILRTVEMRGSITPREAKGFWGDTGRRLVIALCGTDKDDSLTWLSAERSHDMARPKPDDMLVLTRFGRKVVEAIEELCTIAMVVEDQMRRKP